MPGRTARLARCPAGKPTSPGRRRDLRARRKSPRSFAVAAVAAVVSGVAPRGRRIRPLLITGAVSLTAVSVSLTMLRASAPLWLLLAVSIVFGAQNGLNVVTNQAAMYAQAPADAVGAAAGMLRTSMYLGAIASAGLIRLSYGRAAIDPGLHRLGLMLTIAAIALVVLTVTPWDACSPAFTTMVRIHRSSGSSGCRTARPPARW
ncbi:MAG TPA: hypothetical protein VF060_05720 [Trebonia sp.]